MNKKVLFLVNHDLVIYNFRKELVQKLITEGYEVYISSPKGKRIVELESMGCKFIELKNIERHGKNPFTDFKLLKEYKKLIEEIKPLCILTYTIKPNIFGGIASNKNNVLFFPNITGLGTAVEEKGILQFITVNLYKYSFKKVNKVFFQNEENMAFFLDKKIINKKQSILLPGSGVNLDQFKYLEYPNSKDVVKFIFISRIMKEKGIDYYLDLAKLMKKRGEKAEFHICGFCEQDYEDILAELHENKVIIYHGMVDNIQELLKDMHCTIHPTYYPEGLSNVLLESSSSGRPIITTDRSGCREVVNNGENGYLIKVKSLDSLVNAVDNFMKKSHLEKEQMGVQGRKYVESIFDRNIVIDEYMKVILSGEINEKN